MVDLPHPDGPTKATFLPAGMVKDRSRKMGRSGWYAKLTFSKRMEPPVKARGFAPGMSYEQMLSVNGGSGDKRKDRPWAAGFAFGG